MDAGLNGLLRPLQAASSAVAPKAGEAIAAPGESVKTRPRKRRLQDEEAERDKDGRRQPPPSPTGQPDEAAVAAPIGHGPLIDPAIGEHIETAQDSAAGMRAYREKLAGEAASISHRVEKLA